MRKLLSRRFLAALATVLMAVVALHITPNVTYAATITVDVGTITASTADCDLRDAILAANTDSAVNGCVAGTSFDDIELTQDVVLTNVNNTTNGDNGLPSVTAYIWLEGNGHTISRQAGSPEFRLFHVGTGGDLTLNNVILTGGVAGSAIATEGGGAVYVGDGNFYTSDSTITSNSSDILGGAVYLASSISYVDLYNTVVSSNNAAEGGGIYVTSGSLNVDYSDIEFNSATGLGGGIRNNFGTVSIDTSTVRNNSASGGGGQGGGVYSAGTGSLSISSTTFNNNSAGDDGGGVYLTGHTATVGSSTFSANSATDDGGAFFVSTGGTLNLSSSTLANNSAASGSSIANSNGTVNIGNTILSSGSANNCFDTGTTSWLSNDFNLVSDTTCDSWLDSGNDVTGIAAGLLPLADNGGDTLTHLPSNTSPAIDAGSCPTAFVDQRGENRPFDIPSIGPDADDGCDIGAVELEGIPATITVNVGTITTSLADCDLVDAILAAENDAAQNGCPAGDGNLDTIVLTSNVLIETAFLPYIDDHNSSGPIALPPIESGLTIEGNGFTIQRDPASGVNSRLLYIEFDGEVVLDNVTIRDGQVTDQNGGGIYNNGDLTLQNGTVITNNIGIKSGGFSNGGGIYNPGYLIVDASTIRDNISSDDGGGIHSSFGTVDIRNNSLVTNNTASNHGGGIYGSSANIAVSNSTVTDNNAGMDGGGIYGRNSEGGTIIALANSTVARNTAGNDGGGIYSDSGWINTYDTIIDDNNAFDGGGIWADWSFVHLERSAIINNNAVTAGGGIYTSGLTGCDPDCVYYTQTINSNIANNQVVDGSGGGIFAANDVIAFNHSTIANNSVENIHSSGAANFYSYNSIWTNTGTNCVGTAGDSRFNIAHDATCGFTGTADRQNLDPLIYPLASVPAAVGTTSLHRLRYNSPALDAAELTWEDVIGGATPDNLVDQRHTGFIRPVDLTAVTNVNGSPGSDIGAFEAQTMPNRPPTAVADSYSTPGGTTLTVSTTNGVLNNDTDPESDTLTAAVVTNPANGSLTLNADGSFTFVPNAGFSGNASFTYRANDTEYNSAPATVTINVGSVSTPTPSPGSGVGNQNVGGNTSEGTIWPTFEFTLPVDGEGNSIGTEWFRILITSNADNSIILDDWFPVERYCEGVFCAFTPTPEQLPIGFLAGGYQWYVQLWDAGNGLSEITEPSGFEIDPPPPGVPTNITVDTSTGVPIIVWDDDPYAAWYKIIIRSTADGSIIFEFWFQKDGTYCDGTTCRYPLPFDPESGALANGSYTVEIQAWGPGGFNSSDGNAMSGQINFSIQLGESGAPGIPAGGEDWAITNTATGSPTFRWTPAENATWHLLWVGRLDPLPPLTRYAFWVPVSEMDCPNGVTERCTYTPDNMFLTAENYEYQAWLLPWGPGDGSSPFGELGKWAQLGDFRIEVDPPGTATPMTPTGTIDTGIPTFQWDHVPDVTWYNVWVGTFDDSGETPTYTQYHFDWHRAREIGCLVNGTCSIDPEDLYLPEGDYIWFILTYNPAGLGEWSDSGGFTVDKP